MCGLINKARIYVQLMQSKLVFSSTFQVPWKNFKNIKIIIKSIQLWLRELVLIKYSMCFSLFPRFPSLFCHVTDSGQLMESRRDTDLLWAEGNWQTTHSSWCRHKVSAWVSRALCVGEQFIDQAGNGIRNKGFEIWELTCYPT